MIALVVDDDALNRGVLREMLEAVSVTVLEAENGPASLEKAAEAKFDFVLMDIRMPGMDGFTATRAFPKDQRGRSIPPVIVVTADASNDLSTMCFAAGASGLVEKPVKIDELFASVARVITTT